MLAPRWRKVIKDLFSNKMRTLLVVLSISVGVFAVGFVSAGFLILSNDMNEDFLSSNPHVASLYTMPFDDDALAVLRKVEGVAEVEGRSSTSLRVQKADGAWVPLGVTAIPDPDEMHIDQLRPVNPAEIRLEDKEILIDNGSVGMLQVQTGDTITVELSDGRSRQMHVAGIVHDASAISHVFTGQVTAYVTPETMAWLGGNALYNQVVLTVKENATDEAHVRAVTEAISAKLRRSGLEVYATVVIEPGKHPLGSIIDSLLMLMGLLGALAVFLSGFLVINTINALLSQHVRQIGLMKAIGGRTSQIIGMYLALVLFFGVLALIVGMLLSMLVSFAFVQGTSGILNYQPGPMRIPLASALLQAAVALLLPLFAALYPVIKGSRLTVREAISNYGLSAGRFGHNLIDRAVEKINFLPRPLLISLRNTIRRKARLLLTLSTLTLGGAIFIAVFNLGGSFDAAISETLGYFLSDVNVSMGNIYRSDQVRGVIENVEGIQTLEGWGVSNARVLKPGSDDSTEVIVWGPPSGSKLIQPVVTEGRWLLPEDQNAIVVGNHLLQQRPEIQVGDELTLQINNREYPFIVVGKFLMAGTVIPPFIYTNNEYLQHVTNFSGRAFEFRIALEDSTPQNQARVAAQLEQVLTTAGLSVSEVTTGTEQITQQNASIDILVYFLMAMALLIALVGGLGLMGTMSMNVMERTREIGVMRSIGASNGSIVFMVVFEGALIGVISWMLGVLLSLPISSAVSSLVGVTFLTVPMKLVIAPEGFIYWLVIVSVISAVASLLPALNAARLTVRDVLAYE
jgi:putative ABC transport system permease protein